MPKESITETRFEIGRILLEIWCCKEKLIKAFNYRNLTPDDVTVTKMCFQFDKVHDGM